MERSANVLIGLWSALLLLAVVNIGRVHVPFPQLSPLSGIDDFLGAICAISLATIWMSRRYTPRRMLDTAAVATVAGTVGSGLFALASLWFDTKPIGYHFWDGSRPTSDQATLPISVAALGNGRVTGIFNQPAEAGIGYSLGAFAVVYLLTVTRRASIRATLLASLAVILAGGFMSISKIFILVGLPVAVVQFFYSRATIGRVLIFALSQFLFIQFALKPLVGRWQGAFGLTSFFEVLRNRPNGTLNTITAGRWGSPGGGITSAWSTAMHISPWFGLGAGGSVGTPYDSLWLQVLVVDGLLGVGITCLILLVLLVRLCVERRRRPPEVQALGLSLVLLIFLGSTGMTVFTANRASVCLWMLTVPSLLAAWAPVRSERRGSGPAQSVPVPDWACRTPSRLGTYEIRSRRVRRLGTAG